MAFTRSGVRSPSPPFPRPRCARYQGGRWTTGRCAAGERALNSKPLAGIAQLVEHNLAKVGVAGSSPVSRSELQRSERYIGGILKEWPGHTGTRRGVEQ